jgi:hypothetical protein
MSFWVHKGVVKESKKGDQKLKTTINIDSDPSVVNYYTEVKKYEKLRDDSKICLLNHRFDCLRGRRERDYSQRLVPKRIWVCLVDQS